MVIFSKAGDRSGVVTSRRRAQPRSGNVRMTAVGFRPRRTIISSFLLVVLMMGLVGVHVESFTASCTAATARRTAAAGGIAESSSSSTCLFGKKKKNVGGGGGGGGGAQQQQEKKSVKEARFDANTRQFMFTLSRLTKILPDKSKTILDGINLSFYPGAKIGIVGLNGSGYVPPWRSNVCVCAYTSRRLAVYVHNSFERTHLTFVTIPSRRVCFLSSPSGRRDAPTPAPSNKNCRRRPRPPRFRRRLCRKSTLLKIMAGVDTEFDGLARPLPGASIGYLAQEPQLTQPTVQECIDEAVASSRAILAEYNALSVKVADPDLDADEMATAMDQLEVIGNKIDAGDLWELDRVVSRAMDSLRVPPGDAKIETLSGGEKRRTALCRLLLQNHDMLLLDEPTNHLDTSSIAWLEVRDVAFLSVTGRGAGVDCCGRPRDGRRGAIGDQINNRLGGWLVISPSVSLLLFAAPYKQEFLDQFKGTVVCITHDRYFLNNVAGWILELDRGKGYPHEGNYESFLESKTLRLEQEKKEQSAASKAVANELEWIRTNPKAKGNKSKARLSKYDELLSAATPKELRNAGQIYIPPGPRLGNEVVEVVNLRKSFGDRLLIDDLSFSLPPAGIVGVVGPNGKWWSEMPSAA